MGACAVMYVSCNDGPKAGLVLSTYRHSQHCGKTRRVVTLYRGAAVVRPARSARAPIGGGTRGRCLGMSRQARRRLQVALASTDRPPVWFVTLTYAVDPELERARYDLRRWIQEVARVSQRAGGRAAVVWRVERTRRGRIHFHCLVWERGLAEVRLHRGAGRTTRVVARRLFVQRRELSRPGRGRVSASWADRLAVYSSIWVRVSVDDPHLAESCLQRSVHLRAVPDEGAAVGYLSKYVAKVTGSADGGPSAQSVPVAGRQWGRGGDRRLLAPQRWAGFVLPNTDSRVGGLADDIADMGLEAAAESIRLGVGRVVLFALGAARVALMDCLCRWAVPEVRGPPVACRHPSCWGSAVAV